MKYFIVIIIACNLLFAQADQKAYIYGNIIDAESLEPIPYANIFIAESSIGTASDKNGYFELTNLPSGKYDIVASVLGYEVLKVNVRIFNNSKRNFRFEMYRQPIEMEDVIVKGKVSRKRKRQLNQFRRGFLGTSQNGKKTYITNEEVLRFEEKEGALFAIAREPLKIVNNGLGYTILYVLDEYQQTPDEVMYVGYPHFIEQNITTYHDSMNWIDNRKNTYLGSLRHFLTTICANYNITDGDTSSRPYIFRIQDFIRHNVNVTYADTTIIEKNGFYTLKLYYPIGEEKAGSWALINTNNILDKSGNTNELKLFFDDYLVVKYFNEYYPFENMKIDENETSIISMTCDTTILDIEGRYFDKYTIKTEGVWSHERVADMLPFDYIQ